MFRGFLMAVAHGTYGDLTTGYRVMSLITYPNP